MYQNAAQINGKKAHEAVDHNTYSTRKDILQAMDVYCEKYGLVGKIDIFDGETGTLIERKRTIKRIYDGYIFQLYAQYFAMVEMGYLVKRLKLHSVTDNKNYDILLPEKDKEMWLKFEALIYDMRHFDLEAFEQMNGEKCNHCIYEAACDRGVREYDGSNGF